MKRLLQLLEAAAASGKTKQQFYDEIKALLRKSSIEPAKLSASGDRGFGVSPDSGGYRIEKEFRFAEVVIVSFYSTFQVKQKKRAEIQSYADEFKKLLKAAGIRGGYWDLNTNPPNVTFDLSGMPEEK